MSGWSTAQLLLKSFSMGKRRQAASIQGTDGILSIEKSNLMGPIISQGSLSRR